MAASKLLLAIGITSLLAEGGEVLITELLKCNLIDKLIIYRSDQILGNDATLFIGDLGIQSISECYRFKKEEIEFSEDVVEVWKRLPLPLHIQMKEVENLPPIQFIMLFFFKLIFKYVHNFRFL